MSNFGLNKEYRAVFIIEFWTLELRLAIEYPYLKIFLYSMKSLRYGSRQFLTLYPAGFDESEHCGGYTGLSHDSGVAPKVTDATCL